MIEGLRYEFRGETKRGTPISVMGPKTLIDEATARSGPLIDEIRASPAHKFMGRDHDGDGKVTLNFDLNTNRVSYFDGGAPLRAIRTLEVIGQLDAFARRKDAGDPRISIALPPFSPEVADQPQPGESSFTISFERPAGSMMDIAEKIQTGMVTSAKVLHLYEDRGFWKGQVAINPVAELGFDIRMSVFTTKVPMMETGPDSTSKRIELIDPWRRSAQERLTILGGLISVLDPIET